MRFSTATALNESIEDDSKSSSRSCPTLDLSFQQSPPPPSPSPDRTPSPSPRIPPSPSDLLCALATSNTTKDNVVVQRTLQHLPLMLLRNLPALLHGRSRKHSLFPGLERRELVKLDASPATQCLPVRSISISISRRLSEDGWRPHNPPVRNVRNRALLSDQV